MDTKQAIMDAARPMVQSRGYNALSFRDVATAVGVKSASVHYHFPTKGDLGAALARLYTEEAVAYFDALLADDSDLGSCLQKYTDVFRGALLKNNRMCLCGILAAERDDLPVEVRAEVDRFTDANIRWLSQLLSRETPKTRAKEIEGRALAIFSAIGGAQLVARGRGDIAVFDEAIAAYKAAGLLPATSNPAGQAPLAEKRRTKGAGSGR
ncbi:TetR/AcrR family transcriptional regulator [Beijerinckia sp. L45]|uniref:TetR/AcrR family transcriptional regulator n=1 Tax=Beijerinckia sp. L45 TaxID=1641855 RepID=UPI00131BED34|nr:TetR/AcrR family transcriptional regulator [Beijerinckia sp. L45]